MSLKDTIVKLPGKWVWRNVKTGVKIFASFDTHQQFIQVANRVTDIHVAIQLEEHKKGDNLLTVQHISPCGGEEVSIYWPMRKIPKDWYDPAKRRVPPSLPGGIDKATSSK